MRFLRRLAFFLTRRRREADLREEMELHLELRAAANRDRGLGHDQAAGAARRRFGNPSRLAEESRDAWGFSRIDETFQDVRYALRHLARRPGWATAIVLTLAIGIAANASVFGLIDTLLFQPIAGTHAERLVWVSTLDQPSGRVTNMSYPDYARFRDASEMVPGLMAYSGNEFSVGGRPAARLFGDIVSGNYFDVLGVRAALGRTLRPEDDRAGSPAVVVLSDLLWKTRFAGDPAVIDTVVAINGQPFVVVGVAPPGFIGAEIGEDAELWVPLARQAAAMPTSDADLLSGQDSDWLRVVGRLRDGASINQARAELVGIAGTLRPPGSASKRRTSVVVIPAMGGLAPTNRSAVAPVLGLIGLVPLLVLLVACSNVGNVIMANNITRRREFAMRRAIGASRGRLVRQLLAEALVVALVAASAGYLVSFGLTQLIGYLGDVPVSDLATVLGPNLRVLAATTAMAIVTVLIFGLMPAMAATKLDVISALKAHGDRASTARGRLRGAFVVVQVALSLTLLVSAGLFMQSFGRALGVDPAFEARGAVTLSFDPVMQGYTPARQSLFVEQLLERSRALPDVTAAGLTSMLPVSGMTRSTGVLTDGSPASSAFVASISPGYFETMRTPLVAGRAFADSDTSTSPRVAIVNETLARRLWPNQSAQGPRRLRRDGSGSPWLDVVGIVRDGKYSDLTESRRAAFFVPLAQHPAAPLSLVVRTTGRSPGVIASLTAMAAHLDPDLPVYHAEPLEETVRRTEGRAQATASLLAVLGGLTLLLAAIGIYGVAAHSASSRTREVGLRIALGARAADVVGLFVRDGLRLAAIGAVVGLAISAAVSRLLAAFLFGVTATDAMTFVSSAVVLCAVAALASYLPAHRASRIDPAVVLKQD